MHAAVNMAGVTVQARAWGVHWQVAMLGHRLKLLPTLLNINRLAMCSTRAGSLELYITFATAMQIWQNPLWL